MRQYVHTIFDDFVPPSTTVYTSTEYNSRLGSQDGMALHLIVDNVAGGAAGALTCYVEHSGDGRNWMPRNTNGDMVVTILTSGTTFNLLWADPGCIAKSGQQTQTSTTDLTGTPFLPFVRVRVVTAANQGAHVKLHACLRGPR